MSNAHNDSIWAVTWVPPTETRRAFLLTGSIDESVKLWNGDINSKDELQEESTFSGHSLGVVSVAAHPSGAIAASTSLDSFVRIFDVESNATLAVLESPPSEAWLMQFHPTVSSSKQYFFFWDSHYCFIIWCMCVMEGSNGVSICLWKFFTSLIFFRKG